MITRTRLLEVINYDSVTGIFTWKVGTRKIKAGAIAGSIDDDGYRYIRVDRRLYAAHRLAFLYMTGAWPVNGFVDHKNILPGDDRWENLRDVTKKTNQENRSTASSNNKSGLLGVSPNGKRWAATDNTTENGKRKHYYLGTFDTPIQAHSVYVLAKRKLHEGCTL